MIWADRIALGIGALLLLFACYVIPQTISENRQAWAEYQAAVTTNAISAKSHPCQHDAFEAAFGCGIPIPDKPPAVSLWGEFKNFIGTFAGYILSIWIALRIIDFMIGGHARRKISLRRDSVRD